MSHEFKPAVFIDNGSANCKAGPVGEDEDGQAPSVQIRSCVGYPRCKQGLKMRISAITEDFYVGEEAQESVACSISTGRSSVASLKTSMEWRRYGLI